MHVRVVNIGIIGNSYLTYSMQQHAWSFFPLGSWDVSLALRCAVGTPIRQTRRMDMRRPKRKLAGRSSSFHVVCCSWNRRVGGSCRGSSSAEDGVYIEVKSTSSASRELFEVSPAEIDFMRRAGPAYMYEIHRVWDAGSRDVRLARLQHPAAHLAAGKLTLLMSFGGASVPPALHASSDSIHAHDA